jgi:predicted transcriptional regulator
MVDSKRNSWEVLADVVDACKVLEPKSRADLVRIVKQTWSRATPFIEFALRKNLIEDAGDGLYRATPLGGDFVMKMRDLERLFHLNELR